MRFPNWNFDRSKGRNARKRTNKDAGGRAGGCRSKCQSVPSFVARACAGDHVCGIFYGTPFAVCGGER